MPLSFSTDWLTPHLPAWERTLAPFRGKPNIHALEIGCFEGRATCWLLENILTHETSDITCIDPFIAFDLLPFQNDWPRPPQLERMRIDGIEQTFDENISAIGASHRVQKLKGESKTHLRSLPQQYYDIVYIDGSHAPTDVLRDAVLCWDTLKVGGILIFDDYLLQSVTRPYESPKHAIEAFLSVFSRETETLSVGWQLIVRKIAPRPRRMETLKKQDVSTITESSKPTLQEAHERIWDEFRAARGHIEE